VITDAALFLVRMATIVVDEYGGRVDDNDEPIVEETERHLRALGCTDDEIGELMKFSHGMTQLADWKEA